MVFDTALYMWYQGLSTQEDNMTETMVMVPPRDMTDKELATCVDEYVKRAVNRARELGFKDKVQVQIWAWAYNANGDYTIDHSLELSSSSYKLTGSNLIPFVDILVQRIREDRSFETTKVSPQLPAPAPNEEEYTEFEEPKHDYFPDANAEEPI